MPIDLNRIRIFYYIYKQRSVIGAANVLHITQSAVSQQLKKLENEVKVQLFTRLHKQLVPTASGHQLYEMVSPFVERLQNEIPNIRMARERPAGCLRIGGPMEFGKKYFPEVCAAFCKKYPDVRFELCLDHPDMLLPMIKGGALDFAFADIFMKKGEFQRILSIYSIKPILDESLIMVCSKEYDEDHLLNNHSFQSLMTSRYIAYQTEYPAIKSWFKHHCDKTRIEPDVVMTVENVESIIAAVKCHMGLAVIPSHLIQEEISSGELIHIKKKKTEIINRISLVQLQDKIPTLAEKAFLEHFNSFVQSNRITVSSA